MAPWFSASAVGPVLAARWGLGAVGTAWLTISVQLGFVAGALVSAVLTLSDRWSARRLIAGCAVIAGLATVGVAVAPTAAVAITFRLLTGAALAGVYPPGMKLAAGLLRTSRTSTPRWRCLPPRRSRINEAARRGVLGTILGPP